ncbi:43698_t:CDS:1, partial [Gigaspora margarita]
SKAEQVKSVFVLQNELTKWEKFTQEIKNRLNELDTKPELPITE